MGKVSKPVMVLMVLAIVAVVGSLVTLATVMLKGRPTPSTDQKVAAETPAGQPESTPASHDPLSGPAKSTLGIKQGPAGKNGPPAVSTDSQMSNIIANGQGPERPLSADTARTIERMIGRRTPVKAGKVGSLPAAVKVHSLSLDDGQKAAVAKFEETFQGSMDTTAEHNERAMKEAVQGLQAAMDSGNEQLIEQAKAGLQEAAKYQASGTDRLNEQYAEGVRPYLTAEQAAELDKVLKQKTPTAYGYSTTTQPDGTTKVEMVEPGSITVHSSTDDGR